MGSTAGYPCAVLPEVAAEFNKDRGFIAALR